MRRLGKAIAIYGSLSDPIDKSAHGQTRVNYFSENPPNAEALTVGAGGVNSPLGDPCAHLWREMQEESGRPLATASQLSLTPERS